MRKKTVQTSSTKSSTKGNAKSNAKSNTKSNTKSNARNSVKNSAKNSPQKAVKTVAPTAENVSVKQTTIIQEPSVEQNEQNIPTKRHDLAGVFAGFRDGGFTKITEKSDDKSDSCQQNAQNRRKVGGPHAGCLTEFVLLGKYDEKDAD